MQNDRCSLVLALFTTSLIACSSSNFDIGSPEPGADSSITEQDAEGVDTSTSPDTTVPPDDTSIPPTDTSVPPPTDTSVPPPADTSVPVVDGACACPLVGECQLTTCLAGMCSITNKLSGTTCAGGRCNGSGKCVQCTAPSECPGSTPYCNPDGKCVQCLNASQCPAVMGSECKMAVCNAGTCGVGPKPRDSFCNGFNDQCDGAGNCIDCTTSGGCGECCVCLSGSCVPA